MDFKRFLRMNSQSASTLPNHSGNTNESSTPSAGSENDATSVQTREEIRRTRIPKRWSEEEDSRLRSLVSQFGDYRWAKIGKLMESREGKQCRERWKNHLGPNIKKSAWTLEEEKIIVAMHKRDGAKWSKMSHVLEGQTENAIKNHWNASKRRIECKGSYDISSPLQSYICTTIAASSSSIVPCPTRGANSSARENEESSDPGIVKKNSGFDLNLPAESDLDFDLNEPASSC